MPKPLATKACDWNLSYSPEYINNHNNYLPINHVMVCVLVATKKLFLSSLQIYHQHKICKQTLTALLSHIKSKQTSNSRGCNTM